MSILGNTVPSLGWSPVVTDVRVFNRTGATLRLGEVATFDFYQANAEVTSTGQGTANSVYANLMLAVDIAGRDRGGVWACALAPIADNASGMVRLCGPCRAYVYKTSTGAVIKGEGLGVTNAGSPVILDATAAAGKMRMGILLEATTASAVNAGTAELVDILFNGVEGFGGR